jgi:CRISPR/Cas system-associated exonuclease Cas4 (RecB family)
MCYQDQTMKIIRASEVGTYLFCRRAWWYGQHGVESTNQAELAAGTEFHRQHGRTVILSGLTRLLAIILLLAALVLLVTYCTARFI